MLYEYAVEPCSLAEWKDFRYLMEGVGISHGRLISQFPKDWQRKVFDACTAFTFVQKQQLQIELERVKRQALIRSNRNYDGSLPWVDNAINQQKTEKPFHAVIVKDAVGRADYIVGIDDLSGTNPLWKTRREDKIYRTPVALGEAIRQLLSMSSRILFVDKMYHPAESRWQETLIYFIKLASEGRTPPVFEYHSEIDIESLGRPAEQRRQEYQEVCNRLLRPQLPENTSIHLHRWTKWNDNSDFFHARYILTEKGGARIDWGLDAGRPGQKTDVTLLDDDIWAETWDLFQVDAEGKQKSNDFQWIDMVTVRG
ncbi:hypothetical protein [Geomonas subterranea]|uniref:hypothetical protein n=1 Tax=Geomonas subterranea TaxID=2847989 RepID=UPI001CD23A28|nr:hypothetical protein [Geomonas fuzhouensis]